MNRAASWAALALPILGLAGLWANADYQSRQGIEWEVEIQGYDPRDLLRGHYVEFTYDWPVTEEEDGERELRPWERRPIDRLCLYGEPPSIERAERLDDDASDEECEHIVVANPYGIYGNDGLRRGRLYVEQGRALEIQEEMRDTDQQGIVRVRIREDGTVTPVDIRFRPLTDAEIAEREAQAAAREADQEARLREAQAEIAAELESEEE